MSREKAVEFLCSKKAAFEWIEAVLKEPIRKDGIGETIEDFISVLVDGVYLCRVMQAISPRLIPRIKMPTRGGARTTAVIFKTNENVSFFLQACEEIGVPRHMRFGLHDLTNTSLNILNITRVIDCLKSLCKVATNQKQHAELNFHIAWPTYDPSAVSLPENEINEVMRLMEHYDYSSSGAGGGGGSSSGSSRPAVVQVRKAGPIKMAGAAGAAGARVSVPHPPSSPKKPSAAGGGVGGGAVGSKAAVDARAKQLIVKSQAVARGWIARTRYRKMVRSAAYRERVAQEILSTERTYVTSLSWICQNVLTPLRTAAATSSPIISENEIRFIFSTLDVILNYNQLLLSDLELRVGKGWTPHQRLGDIFLTIASFLKIYSQYCSNYTEALKVLMECKKNPKWVKFYDELKKKNDTLQMAGLEDYLIRPVQRIPRYNLLLQDLVKHTDRSHPDYANIQAAIAKVKSVAEHMNERKREFENILKVSEIQERMEGGEPLARAHRRFVKEGEVMEFAVPDESNSSKSGSSRKGLGLTPVMLFLFNDILVVAKAQSSKSKSVKSNFQQSLAHMKYKVVKLEPEFSPPNMFAFGLVSPNSSRPLRYFAVSSEPDRDSWVSAIDMEGTEARAQAQAQDDRITSKVMDKVEDAKKELERQFHTRRESVSDRDEMNARRSSSGALSPSPLSSSSGSPAAGSPLRSDSGDFTLPLSPSTSESGLDVGKMSLREKRLALQKESAHGRRPSGSGSPLATSSSATSPLPPSSPLSSNDTSSTPLSPSSSSSSVVSPPTSPAAKDVKSPEKDKSSSGFSALFGRKKT
eukprot:TRINITY_DN5015_c0_g1_i2.p1 TRINITY_DN5015_c0_g1~~TRINITY_DN5015_c0_g1_i2.p1  ORF type:complete len:810 (-),score=195.49 TRINITY_DN5015_c0_g1_i2:112-2541(-)